MGLADDVEDTKLISDYLLVEYGTEAFVKQKQFKDHKVNISGNDQSLNVGLAG